MVNTHLAPEEAAYIVNDCGAHTVITSSALAQLATDLVPLTPDVDLRLMVGDHPGDGHTSYDEFVGGIPECRWPTRSRVSDAVFVGHNRQPQGHTPPDDRRALRFPATLAPMSGGIMGFGEGNVYLNPAPLYHSAPLIWSMTVQRMGGTVVLMEHFDPERCLQLINEHKVPRSVRPDHVRPPAQAPRGGPGGYDVSSLQSIVHAAAPCAPEVKRRMIEWWGPIIHEYYSGTEGMGMTWITSPEALSHPGSVGKAIWGEAHICGEDGNELPTGEDGVVYFGSAGAPPPSNTTTTPRRPRRASIRTAGARCGTSATSTTRATSTSLTASSS